jgi:hypothetical protein
VCVWLGEGVSSISLHRHRKSQTKVLWKAHSPGLSALAKGHSGDLRQGPGLDRGLEYQGSLMLPLGLL